jgi:predicted nucleotidyltransferase
MTSGTTIKRIKTVIQSTVESAPAVETAWGFGSFFRGTAFNDVDVLIVLKCAPEELADQVRLLRSAFLIAERKLKLQFDLLFLTPEEFSSRPLHDMDQLVLLYPSTTKFGGDPVNRRNQEQRVREPNKLSRRWDAQI